MAEKKGGTKKHTFDPLGISTNELELPALGVPDAYYSRAGKVLPQIGHHAFESGGTAYVDTYANSFEKWSRVRKGYPRD